MRLCDHGVRSHFAECIARFEADYARRLGHSRLQRISRRNNSDIPSIFPKGKSLTTPALLEKRRLEMQSRNNGPQAHNNEINTHGVAQ
jgi:hypothetical protein